MDCDGKVRFDVVQDAQKAAHRRRGLTAYKCGECGAWHVGGKFGINSSERRGFRKRRRASKYR
jgi:hypothetical protein